MGFGLHHVEHTNQAYPLDVFQPAEDILQEALRLAATDKNLEYAQRVEFLMAGLQHARLTSRFIGMLDHGRVPHGRARYEEARKALKELLEFRKTHEHLYIADLSMAANKEQRRMPGISSILSGIVADDKSSVVESFRLASEGWRFKLDPDNRGIREKWYLSDYNDGDWDEIEIERAWQDFGYDYVGIAWYRGSFDMPSKVECDRVEVHFGAIDESGFVFVNGKFAGKHDIGPGGWDTPFSLDITELVEWEGRNHIAVRARNTAAAGGIWQPVNINMISVELEPWWF